MKSRICWMPSLTWRAMSLIPPLICDPTRVSSPRMTSRVPTTVMAAAAALGTIRLSRWCTADSRAQSSSPIANGTTISEK